ncbi:transposase zinc-binding domain-containing protein, partial [bacterium]|nr:transposase zinc-binding domain-containing protein [bacterium]
MARARQDDPDIPPVPAHVERTFRKYLECGILAHGFARARCSGCGHDFLIAFSCRTRGLCPSCDTRRMAETAAHLTDHVIPRVPIRQWVLSLPKRLRWFLRHRPETLAPLLKVFLRAVETALRQA